MSDPLLLGVAGCLVAIIACCVWALVLLHQQDRKRANDWNDRRRQR